LYNRERGLSLLETTIALAVLGVVAIVILSALITGAKASNTAWEQATAESLTRSEIEYIKSLDYQATYDVEPLLSMPVGWEILEPISVELVADSLQKIIITIKREGKTVLSVVTYKGEKQ